MQSTVVTSVPEDQVCAIGPGPCRGKAVLACTVWLLCGSAHACSVAARLVCAGFVLTECTHALVCQVESLMQRVADEHGLELEAQLNEPQVCLCKAHGTPLELCASSTLRVAMLSPRARPGLSTGVVLQCSPTMPLTSSRCACRIPCAQMGQKVPAMSVKEEAALTDRLKALRERED